MSRRRSSLVLGAAVLITLPGCGPRSAGPSAEDDDDRATTPKQAPPVAATIDRGALPQAGRIAVRYAVAARSWTPANYRAQHRLQLRLATGPLRRALEQATPTREQLAAYRADGARVTAIVDDAVKVLQTATQARYEIVLDERSTAAEEEVQERVTYIVELLRRDGAWRVAGFTVSP